MKKYKLFFIICLIYSILLCGCNSSSTDTITSETGKESDTSMSTPSLGTQTEEPKPDDYRVFFIGNSLISYGKQAEFLEDIAQSYGIQISVDQVTWGGATLRDYLEETFLPKKDVKPRMKQADIVVFQDFGGWRGEETIRCIRKLKKWCKKDARFYYYMYDGDYEEMVSEDYEQLKNLKLQCIPKGQLITALEDITYSYEELHLEGDFHPNNFNGYLAALVMNSVIFDKKCSDFPWDGLFGEKSEWLSFSTQQVIDALRGDSEEEKWEEFQRIGKIADDIIRESRSS